MIVFQLVLFLTVLSTCFIKAGTDKLILLTVQVILAALIALAFLICGRWFSGILNLVICVVGVMNMSITRKTMDLKNKGK